MAGSLSRSEHVLLVTDPNCIICTKEMAYYTDRFDRKRKRDKLVSAQTLGCKKLKEAAKELSDKRLLQKLQGQDFDAIQINYHKRCYAKYTKSALQHARKASQPPDYSRYMCDRAFKVFCEQFIQPKIIKNKGVFRMTTLKDAFVKTVEAVESLDVSGYRTHRLKRRMKRQYPKALVFLATKHQNKSDLVYSSEMTQADVAEAVKVIESSESVLSRIANKGKRRHECKLEGMHQPNVKR